MKIGIEVQRLFRKKKHGMDIVALELVRNLQQIDNTNEYFIFVKPDVDDQVIRETSNFHIIRIDGGPYPYWEQVLLPRELKKYNLDLLHCTSNTAPLWINIPLLITVHDIIFLEQWNFTKGSSYQIVGNLYRRWNVPPVVKRSAHIITVSDNENRNIQKYFGLTKDHVTTVYNGVGTHFRKTTDPSVMERIRKKYSLPDHYVFFLGNTDPRKNLAGVLSAMSILKKSNKLNFQLQMLDIDRTYLAKVAAETGANDILPHVSFCGYVPEEDLPVIYSMSSLFLYPSLREGFGIPILEAMSCEVPVITSNTSSMPEVAGNAALLVDPFNAASIAEGILQVFGNPSLRDSLVQKGVERSAQFSWRNNAIKTHQLYQAICKSASQTAYATEKM